MAKAKSHEPFAVPDPGAPRRKASGTPSYEQLRLGLESESRVIPAASRDALSRFIIGRQVRRGAIHAPDLVNDPDDIEDARLEAIELQVARDNRHGHYTR